MTTSGRRALSGSVKPRTASASSWLATSPASMKSTRPGHACWMTSAPESRLAMARGYAPLATVASVASTPILR